MTTERETVSVDKESLHDLRRKIHAASCFAAVYAEALDSIIDDIPPCNGNHATLALGVLAGLRRFGDDMDAAYDLADRMESRERPTGDS